MDMALLAGSWTLISWQVVSGDEAQDLFGTNPKGYMILTREGRAMTVTTAETRPTGESEQDRAELHKSMLAYTGKYRIEGDEFTTPWMRLGTSAGMVRSKDDALGWMAIHSISSPRAPRASPPLGR